MMNKVEKEFEEEKQINLVFFDFKSWYLYICLIPVYFQNTNFPYNICNKDA